MIQLVLKVFIILATISGVFVSQCDQLNTILISPCRCVLQANNHESIFCDAATHYDLKSVFNYMSDALPNGNKHFYAFYLMDGGIREIPENAFNDITFELIYFSGAFNLKRIHSRAFTATAFTLNELTLANDNLLVNEPPEYDFYNAFSSLVKLKYLSITFVSNDTQIIPKNAFRPLNGVATGLTSIYFLGNSKIELKNYAFYDFPQLTTIHLRQHQIDYIPAHAFDLRKSSHLTLTIELGSNNLNGSSFELGAFSNIKRPVYLELFINYKLSYLNQLVFEPFFRADKRNVIALYQTPLDCDCRNLWLMERRDQLENRVIGAQCKDGTPLFNFNVTQLENCKTSINSQQYLYEL